MPTSTDGGERVPERSKLYIYCTYVHIIHLWHCVVTCAYVEAKPHAGNIICTLCTYDIYVYTCAKYILYIIV